MITIIILFVLLAVTAFFQIRAANGPRRYPGPGVSFTPSATAATP
jgi:hypothetical protein